MDPNNITTLKEQNLRLAAAVDALSHFARPGMIRAAIDALDHSEFASWTEQTQASAADELRGLLACYHPAPAETFYTDSFGVIG